MIQFQHVSKSYSGGTPVVHDLSLDVSRGELLVLLGESGCGKTTTLKMINRLIEPSSGVILIEGVENTRVKPSDLRRSIGYVFQGVGLFPHMTVPRTSALYFVLGDGRRNKLATGLMNC